MKDEYAQFLTNMNYRVMTLLGMAVAIMAEESLPNNNHKEKVKWFLDSVDEVVYKNNPLPRMPD